MIFLYEIAFDCQNPQRVADFWAEALGYEQQKFSQEERDAAYEAHPEWRTRAVVEDLPARNPRLYLQTVPEPKVGRNRMRFEVLLPESGFEAEVDRLLEIGATRLDGSRLADPEGNEFDVVPSGGPARFGAIVVEALDPVGLAEFWSALFRFPRDGTRIHPPPDWLAVESGRAVWRGRNLGCRFPAFIPPPDGRVHTLAPGMAFVPTDELKQRKNRIHLDPIALDSADYEVERARVVALGAGWEDPATGHAGMFDPEGNEFCLHDQATDV